MKSPVLFVLLRTVILTY